MTDYPMKRTYQDGQVLLETYYRSQRVQHWVWVAVLLVVQLALFCGMSVQAIEQGAMWCVYVLLVQGMLLMLTILYDPICRAKKIGALRRTNQRKYGKPELTWEVAFGETQLQKTELESGVTQVWKYSVFEKIEKSRSFFLLYLGALMVAIPRGDDPEELLKFLRARINHLDKEREEAEN